MVLGQWCQLENTDISLSEQSSVWRVTQELDFLAWMSAPRVAACAQLIEGLSSQ